MEHRTMEQIAQIARIARADKAESPLPWWLVRRRRLERLAALLDDRAEPLALFTELECFPKKERLALRQAGSPLAVAFEDAAFREEGLSGDTVGEAMAFFHLSTTEAHRLLCSCGYAEARFDRGPASETVARRARSIAARRTFAELYEMAKAVAARWR